MVGQMAELQLLDSARRRWSGLPVIVSPEESFAGLMEALPQFGRQPFTMASVNGSEVAINPYLDMVYRMPVQQGEKPIPVGVVSKNYRLVDHHQLLRTVEAALVEWGMPVAKLKVRGEWTVHGERARFSLLLPPDDKFRIHLDGEDEMRFRIEIFNSVEGSSRLMVVAGWLRFICSNGLIIGTALLKLRQQHRQQLEVEEIGRLLVEALNSIVEDKSTVTSWRKTKIADPHHLSEWVDMDVCAQWGPKAAVRVLAISKTGKDAEPIGDLKNKQPSAWATRSTNDVPGISLEDESAFGLSQVLTWVAGQRSDLQEELEWRSHVPGLMRLLMKRLEAKPNVRQ